jgi:hypothetical protein
MVHEFWRTGGLFLEFVEPIQNNVDLHRHVRLWKRLSLRPAGWQAVRKLKTVLLRFEFRSLH